MPATSRYDGELVSLNSSLVRSRSSECWSLLSQSRDDPSNIETLLGGYTGRFALDFSYEDWAADYRDNLHAAFLAATETAMTAASAGGDFDAAIRVGHRVLAIDPEADSIELALLRAYKSGRRHAAAAEQYAHYAAYLRDELGIDPPPLDDL